jgi:hypothetical protein
MQLRALLSLLGDRDLLDVGTVAVGHRDRSRSHLVVAKGGVVFGEGGGLRRAGGGG